MRSLIIFISILTGFCRCVCSSEQLSAWLLGEVKRDEQLLADALSKADGHSLELLKESPSYVPFFLEAPGSHIFASNVYKPFFDTWKNDNGQIFLSGGYIYRLRFSDAPPLYATSAGYWGGSDWYSLDLGKDFVVEPSSVCNGSGDDYLFATTVAGVPPKIIVYDKHGEVKREEVFDVNVADLEERVAAGEQAFSEKGSPLLEMISLAEYLKTPDGSWREVDLSGPFNLRNQQQRDAERERLKSGVNLTRNEAVNALQSKLSPQAAQRGHALSESRPGPPATEKPGERNPARSTQAGVSPSATLWPAVAAAVAVVSVLGLLWVALKKLK